MTKSVAAGLPGAAAPAEKAARHLNISPEDTQRDLAKLVLVVVELLRRLLEKQALRRIEGGRLSVEQVERLGTGLMNLEAEVRRLQGHFGIEDLDIDLGPLGQVLGDRQGSRPRAEG